MVHLARIIAGHPLQFLKFCYSFLTQSLLDLAERIFLPHYPVYQSLRTRIARAYLAAAAIHLPDIVHRLPVTACPSGRARKVGDAHWKGYVVPGSHTLQEQESRGKLVVALYAHGGGYVRGEARQYLNYMERWISVAVNRGIDLVFLSVEYPLSTEAAHPAQRDSFLAGYRYLLDQGMPTNRVVFMGDSAGAAMSILSATELPALNLPQPACSVLISPWLDTSLSLYAAGGNPLSTTDYVNTANTSVPLMFGLFLGGKKDGSDPDVNPLCRKPNEMHFLNPQLILTGGAEMAMWDGRRWAHLCGEAGVSHELVVEWGQLHIYAMGSKWVERRVREKTEERIISWIDEWTS
ncbi:alpha/beta-hydrolase [Aspergillus pseudoustus]|uniref:Alpha/beta-hydrolase n=1 Tax=Aspergillus pseudoustus TaxID=1810923 RepID=A0ABR4ITC6_9EURO